MYAIRSYYVFTYLSSPQVQSDWHQATGYVPITYAAFELTKT